MNKTEIWTSLNKKAADLTGLEVLKILVALDNMSQEELIQFMAAGEDGDAEK